MGAMSRDVGGTDSSSDDGEWDLDIGTAALALGH